MWDGEMETIRDSTPKTARRIRSKQVSQSPSVTIGRNSKHPFHNEKQTQINSSENRYQTKYMKRQSFRNTRYISAASQGQDLHNLFMSSPDSNTNSTSSSSSSTSSISPLSLSLPLNSKMNPSQEKTDIDSSDPLIDLFLDKDNILMLYFIILSCASHDSDTQDEMNGNNSTLENNNQQKHSMMNPFSSSHNNHIFHTSWNQIIQSLVRMLYSSHCFERTMDLLLFPDTKEIRPQLEGRHLTNLSYSPFVQRFVNDCRRYYDEHKTWHSLKMKQADQELIYEYLKHHFTLHSVPIQTSDEPEENLLQLMRLESLRHDLKHIVKSSDSENHSSAIKSQYATTTLQYGRVMGPIQYIKKHLPHRHTHYLLDDFEAAPDHTSLASQLTRLQTELLAYPVDWDMYPEVEDTQMHKDMLRDIVYINGKRYESEPVITLFRDLVPLILRECPGTTFSEARVLARIALQLATRTISGGDAFEAVTYVFEDFENGITIFPASSSSSSGTDPINISIFEGRVSVSGTTWFYVAPAMLDQEPSSAAWCRVSATLHREVLKQAAAVVMLQMYPPQLCQTYSVDRKDPCSSMSIDLHQSYGVFYGYGQERKGDLVIDRFRDFLDSI